MDGVEAIAILDEMSGGDYHTAPSWTSGKPGRFQIMFKIPEHYQDKLKDFTRHAIREWGEKRSSHDLDFRYNDCQSCLPPSLHPETGSYKEIRPICSRIAPQWLLTALDRILEQVEVTRSEQQAPSCKKPVQTGDDPEINPNFKPHHIINLAQYLEGYDLNGRKGWITCKCPAHNGKSFDSLHIEKSSGAYKCHAGCNPKDIYRAAVEIAKSKGCELPKRPGNNEFDSLRNVVERVAQWIERSRQKTPFKFQRVDPATLETSQLPPSNPLIYEVSDRLTVWQGAVENGVKFIADTSNTGTGKSYDAGRVRPELLGVSRCIYVSRDHRNPSTLTLEDWDDLGL